MGNLKDEAQAYEQKQTRNISDLDEVSVDFEIKDDSFTFKEKDKEGKEVEKTVDQKVIIVNGEKYRVPVSVIVQLKAHLEDNPDLTKFKVKKTGEGLKTEYVVIPIIKSGLRF